MDKNIKKYDLIVIGGGPGGYVSAIRAAQLGMKTVVLEKGALGGACLNVGCIPTKALFESATVIHEMKQAEEYGVQLETKGLDFSIARARKDRVVGQLVRGVTQLLKKNGVDVVFCEVSFKATKQVVDKKSGDVYEGKNILICTGTENAVPPIPGIDGAKIGGSTELLAIKELPESIAVLGGGVIGCEFANILSAFGCKVTLIEMLPMLLGNMEAACGELLEKKFATEGIQTMLGTRVKSIVESKDGAKEIVCEKDGKESKVMVDYVFVATGRKPNTASLNIEAVGIRTEKGFIQVNEYMETSIAGIYAAGDITGKSALAHTASEGGVIAVENMNGNKRKADFQKTPKVVFVQPEMASAGMTEQEANDAGFEVICGTFDLSGNGKAIAMGKSNGFVKVVAEKENHQILGIHMAGPSASELVTLFTSLLEMEAVLEEVEHTIYPHPAVAEAIREACLDALGRAVHK